MEEFFDDRWTIEDLGPFRHEVETVADRLTVEDLQAVQGPERVIPNNIEGVPGTTIRARWAQSTASRTEELHELAEFCRAAIVALSRRFGQTSVHFVASRVPLPDLEGVLAADGLTLEGSARLRMRLEAGSPCPRVETVERTALS